jgi:hypothetical protein
MPSIRALSAVLIATVAALTCGNAAAGRLNDTGIDFCTDPAGAFIDCEGTGQDATTGRDVTRPHGHNGRLGFHFTKLCNSGERAGEGSCPAKPKPGDAPNEWGCTRDEVTDLVWETKTKFGPRAGANRYTFYSPEYDPDGQYGSPTDLTGFLNSVNEAGLCGAHDWRLPTPTELLGIIDMGALTFPHVEQRYFPFTWSSHYWGAGTVLGRRENENTAWSTSYLLTEEIGTHYRSDPWHVQLVRDGQPDRKRFVISSDQQEVTDRWSGLTWRRCVEGTSFDGRQCSGTPLPLPWTDALAHAQEQAHDTGVAWRLPNLKELASLLDFEHLPRLKPHFFPDAKGTTVLWTSSSRADNPAPRCVDFYNGMTSTCPLGNGPVESRLVRDKD